jgi:putative transcriptional regulator
LELPPHLVISADVLLHRSRNRLEEISLQNRLRVLRAERDWTQSDLASRLNVSRQTVNSIETERYEPSLSLAFRIAKLFGLTIEQIFEVDDSETTEQVDESRS